MNYTNPFPYTPNQTQVAELGRTEPLETLMELGTGNLAVTDALSNGVFMGDMIGCSRNPDWHPGINDGTPRERYAITDLYNAEQAVRLARISIDASVERNHEHHDAVASVLPIFATPGVLTDTERTTIREQLEGPLERLTRARNYNNQQAGLELECALAILERRGRSVSIVLHDRLLGAATNIKDRKDTLFGQVKANKQRQAGIERYKNADTMHVASILGMVAGGGIIENSDKYVDVARKRLLKPGNLTEQNAHFRAARGDADADRGRLLATSFESLYGIAMQPMSRLSRLVMSKTVASPDLASASLIVSLTDLEDLVDVLATPGGDYINLALGLQSHVREAQQNVLDQDFTAAKKTAVAFKRLLRYRTDDLSTAPAEWFTPLPAKASAKQRDMTTEELFALFK